MNKTTNIAASNNPVTGMKSLFSGLALINKPGIRSFVLIPLLINIAIFIIALAVGIHYFSFFMDKFLDFSGLWDWVAAILNLFKPILWMLFFIIYLVFVFYTFSIIANIIASPFNSLLAEATEKYLIGKPELDESNSIKKILGIIVSSIVQEIQKLIYFILRAIPLLILFIIPFTMPIAPFLWFIFTAWMMTLQYMDYPFANHDIAFKHQIIQQKQKRWFSLGFGSTILVITMIPIINFIVMPLAVISATKVWVNNYRE